MVNIRTAAAGRRRYGMGETFAPTRGKVNPAGYVQREMRNRISQPRQGQDNFSRPSQQRSGLAAKALQNMVKQNPPRMLPKKPVGNGPNKGPNYQKPGDWLKKNPQPPKRSGGGGGNQPAPAGPTLAPRQFNAPVVPPVKINANGRLDLPFNAAYSLGLVEQQQAADAELMNLQQEEQQWGLDLQTARRDLDNQFVDIKRDTLNDHSGRGLAFSSGYQDAVVDNQNQYNNFTNDLSTQDALARSGFSNARMGIENSMNSYIQMATQQMAEELAAEAGTLGYYQDANGNWMVPPASAGNITKKSLKGDTKNKGGKKPEPPKKRPEPPKNKKPEPPKKRGK